MINIMNGTCRNFILGFFLALTVSFYFNGDIAQARTVIIDGVLEEATANFGGPSVAEEDVKAGQISKPPVILDVLDLKNMDILDVLKLVSQKSGMNIVAGRNVKGKVTVFLKNVEMREALRIIVEAYGWAYVQDGDILRVMTDKEYETRQGYRFGQKLETRIKQLSFAKMEDVVSVLNEMKSPFGKVISDQKSGMLILKDEPGKLDVMGVIIDQMDIPIRTEVFVLNYAKADEISAKISEMLTVSLGTLRFDERSNRIIISDTIPKINEIREVIEAFDQRDKEVLIEAKILQIVLSDEYKLGVDWEGMISDFHNLNLKSNFDILGETEKQGEVSIGTVERDGYTALIEALETVGQTDILSSPRIAVMNNKEAKILVGSTEPYVTSTTTTPASGPTTTAESINFIEVGVKLFVTPTIHEDGFITMKIKPEVSSVTSNVTTSNNNTIPIVETSEAETTVIVKDGVTIVIGGLIKEESIKTIKKIPLIGDIPFLGLFFQNKSTLVRNTEIVIFLTPTIITGDVGDDGQLAVF